MKIPWDGSFWDGALLSDIDEAFEKLEAGQIPQAIHVHVDSCGNKGCQECWPIPPIYVTWEDYKRDAIALEDEDC